MKWTIEIIITRHKFFSRGPLINRINLGKGGIFFHFFFILDMEKIYRPIYAKNDAWCVSKIWLTWRKNRHRTFFKIQPRSQALKQDEFCSPGDCAKLNVKQQAIIDSIIASTWNFVVLLNEFSPTNFLPTLKVQVINLFFPYENFFYFQEPFFLQRLSFQKNRLFAW